MAQRKITSSGIGENIEFQGDSITIPAGTTAERPATATPGMIRYNTTTGFMEQYAESGWQGITPPPTISSISVDNLNESDTTQTIVITGQNFDPTASGLLIDANGTLLNPTTSTRNSSSQITIVYSGGDVLTSATPEPLSVRVIAGSGLAATLENAINVDATPAWSTSAGNIGTVYEDVAISTITLSATDPEGSTVTYSITSGALPSGLSLSSSGNITGTPNVNDSYVSAGVTHNFTVTASDGTGNSTPRSFNILRKWYDGSTSTTAATSGQALVNLGITDDGVYWLKPPGGSGTAFQAYVMNSVHGGGWVKFAQYYNNTNLNNTSGVNLNGSWIQSERNLNAGVLNYADINALQSNGTNTGFLMSRYSGPNGKYRFWRYVEGATISGHHPRVSRIVLVEPNGNQRDAFVFIADNCNDAGTYQVGTTGTYDAGTAITVAHVKEFNTNTAVRSAYFTLQGSNNGSSWTNVISGIMSASTCELLDTINLDYPDDVGGLDPFLNFDVGLGGFFLTSGTLANFGTYVDPTATYDLKIDKTRNGSWDTVVRYTNDTRGLCTHTTAGTKIWYSDHNYNGTVISGSNPQNTTLPICWSIGTNALGANLHWMSGTYSGQSAGDMYYGVTDTASLGLWIK